MKFKLCEVCKIINGRAYSYDELLEHGKYPILRVGNFFSSDKWYYSDMELSPEKYCNKGDLLFAWSASFGPKIWEGEKVIYHYHIWKLIPDENIVDKYYLFYWLKDSANYIKSANHGSVMAHLTKKDMENLVIELPDLITQQKVATVLKDIDTKIKINESINDNLEKQAQLIIRQYSDGIISKVHLHEIMDFDNGFPFQSKTYLDSGKYKIITIKNVTDGRIDTTGTAFIDTIPQKMKPCCKLEVGDVLVSLTGNVGRVGIVCESNLLLNQRVAKVKPKDANILPFLYFVFRQPAIKEQMIQLARGTAQANLSPVETLKMSIPFEKETAISLSSMLSPLFNQIIQNNREVKLLVELRDYLLPRLLNGQISVGD